MIGNVIPIYESNLRHTCLYLILQTYKLMEQILRQRYKVKLTKWKMPNQIDITGQSSEKFLKLELGWENYSSKSCFGCLIRVFIFVSLIYFLFYVVYHPYNILFILLFIYYFIFGILFYEFRVWRCLVSYKFIKILVFDNFVKQKIN